MESYISKKKKEKEEGIITNILQIQQHMIIPSSENITSA